MENGNNILLFDLLCLTHLKIIYFLKNLLCYPSIKIASLNFRARLEMNVMLHIIKIVIIIIIIIIIIIKKDRQCKAGRGRLPPYQSEDPRPTLPTYRGKEEKGKIVEDKKVESN